MEGSWRTGLMGCVCVGGGKDGPRIRLQTSRSLENSKVRNRRRGGGGGKENVGEAREEEGRKKKTTTAQKSA